MKGDVIIGMVGPLTRLLVLRVSYIMDYTLTTSLSWAGLLLLRCLLPIIIIKWCSGKKPIPSTV